MSTTSTSSGWNRSNSTPKPAPKKPSALRGVLAGLVVVALAAACVFVFMGKENKKPVRDVKKSNVIKEVKPKVVYTNAPAKATAAKAQDKSKVKPGELVVISSVTNGTHVRTIVRKPDGKTKMILGTVGAKPIYDNASDQVLAMASEVVPGDDAPPLPITDGIDQEFLDSLKRNIVINEDDSEEVKLKKQNAIDLRNQIIELIKDGGSVKDVLIKHQEFLKDSADFRTAADKILKQMVDDGDIEGAKAYAKRANELLGKKGIRPLEEPLTEAEKAEKIKNAQESQNNQEVE